MKKLLTNEKIAKVAETTKEKRELYEALKENKAYTKEGFAKALYKLKSNTGDSISAKEASTIGREVLGSGIGSSKRYIISEKEKGAVNKIAPNIVKLKPANIQQNSPTSSPKPNSKIQTKKMEGDHFVSAKSSSIAPLPSQSRSSGSSENNDHHEMSIYDIIRQRNTANNEDQKAA